MTWKRNVEGMKSHAQHRSQEARNRVDQAITTLVREQKPINFNTVAQAARVTKSYLYTQPDVRARITALRTSQAAAEPPRQLVSHQRTNASKDILLAAKERRIKALEEENRQLKKHLKQALGKMYERL
jgi:hypothetical protein